MKEIERLGETEAVGGADKDGVDVEEMVCIGVTELEDEALREGLKPTDRDVVRDVVTE